MPEVATEITVAANGQVYVAPTSAAAPTTVSDPLATWSQVGLVSEQGARLVDAEAYEEVDQKDRPSREIPTERRFLVAFTMRQWSGFNVALAFGGTIASQGGGKWKFTPTWSSTTSPDERSMVIDWQDEELGKNYRLYIPRGVGTATVEPSLNGHGPGDLLVVFEALGETPWKLYSDDPALSEPVLRTHTADAVLRVTTTRTHTADARVVSRVTRTHTTDAMLHGPFTKTHTTDASVKALGTTKTHTADALLTGGWGQIWGGTWGS